MAIMKQPPVRVFFAIVAVLSVALALFGYFLVGTRQAIAQQESQISELTQKLEATNYAITQLEASTMQATLALKEQLAGMHASLQQLTDKADRAAAATAAAKKPAAPTSTPRKAKSR